MINNPRPRRLFQFPSFTNWGVWIFPLIAIGMAVYLFYDEHRNNGPLIRIKFSDVAGVEPQKTLLRYRGVEVGHITEVRLANEGKEVHALARMRREASHLAVEGTRFRIIEPQVDM